MGLDRSEGLEALSEREARERTTGYRMPAVFLGTCSQGGLRSVQISVKLEVFGPLVYIMESLILAQNERWRRVLSMQVVRQGGATCPRAADW